MGDRGWLFWALVVFSGIVAYPKNLGDTMKRIIRFFPYYGAKASRWKKYPEPEHDVIIEPFAGSAAYSLHHADRWVILHDLDPIIADVWNWLIHVSEDEFMALPSLEGVERVSDLGLSNHAAIRYLMFWANEASDGKDKISPFMKENMKRSPYSQFTEKGKERLCKQLRLIRHWEVNCSTYHDAPDIEATWFIDPPYQGKPGSSYRMSSKHIDYQDLGSWCRSRKGLKIVCEGEGAEWLPFVDLHSTRNASSKNVGSNRKELVWIDRS